LPAAISSFVKETWKSRLKSFPWEEIQLNRHPMRFLNAVIFARAP
jgi:hypothetical protein